MLSVVLRSVAALLRHLLNLLQETLNFTFHPQLIVGLLLLQERVLGLLLLH
jgi:hypothetical protein